MSELFAQAPGLLLAHLLLAGTALTAGVALSLPLGIALSRFPRLERPALAAAGAVQTIPSLALLATMVPLLALVGLPSIGVLPAFLGLVLYAVLPILQNTLVGLAGVDAFVLEAARGVGMTERQVLTRVQLPLAAPVILAGIRTAAVWTVGAATLSTPVGAPSLGNFIFSGLQTRNFASVLLGAGLAAGLALAIDRALQRLVAEDGQRDPRPILAGGLAVLVLAALAWGPSAARTGPAPVRIGSKTFTEQYVLAQLLAERARGAGAPVELLPSLGSTVAFDALVAGDLDAYVDYSGTIWATVMKRGMPRAREEVLPAVREWLSREHGIVVLARLGFENTYALAMRRDDAAARGVRSLGALARPAPQLALAGDYEFFGRPEWPAVRDGYGLAFGRVLSMESALMYQALAHRQVDVSVAFSTDGRIAAYDLVVLEDERGVIPPYDAIVLAGPRLAREYPAAATALAALDGKIDAAAMRRANQAVDLEGLGPGEAAKRLERGLP